jgi:hypothetical protein
MTRRRNRKQPQPPAPLLGLGSVEIVFRPDGSASVAIHDKREFDRLTTLAASKGMTLDQFMETAVRDAIHHARSKKPGNKQ